MTHNILGEEDDKDEEEHGDETGLKQSSVAIPLLKPGTSKDGTEPLSVGSSMD